MKRRVIIFFIFASLLLLLTACITDEIENKDIVFMNGEVLIELEAHDEFEDPGITMPDNFTLIRNENINIDRIGSYEIHYKVLDNEGVVYKEMIRVINVYDFTAPEIIVSNDCVINLGIDEGLSSCFDLSDNYYSIEELVVDISVEDFNSANLTGSYIVNISATDPSDNNATTSFNVEIVLDYFEIIQHLTTYSNDILSITYDEAGGPYQKPSYWINFLSGDRLNISSDEDFYYVMRYSTEMFSGLLFFYGNFNEMTNTSLSISVKRSYSSTSSWLRLNDFDASEQYDSLDLSESSFSNDGNINYDDALATFNEKALEAITQLKYIYEEILGIKLTI